MIHYSSLRIIILLSLLMVAFPNVTAQDNNDFSRQLKFGEMSYDSSISTEENWGWQTDIIDNSNPSFTQRGWQDYDRSTIGDRTVASQIFDVNDKDSMFVGFNTVEGQLTSGASQLNTNFYSPQTYGSEGGWNNNSQKSSLEGVDISGSYPFVLPMYSEGMMIPSISTMDSLSIFKTSLGNGIVEHFNPIPLDQLYSDAPNSPLVVANPDFEHYIYPENRWQNIYMALIGLVPSNGALSLPPIELRTLLAQSLNVNTELLLVERISSTQNQVIPINGENHDISYSATESSFELSDAQTYSVEINFPDFNSISNPNDHSYPFDIKYMIDSTIETTSLYDSETDMLLGTSGLFDLAFNLTIQVDDFSLGFGQSLDIVFGLQVDIHLEFSNTLTTTNLAYGGEKMQSYANDYFDIGDRLIYQFHSNSNLTHELQIGEGLTKNYFLKGFMEEWDGLWELEFYSSIPESTGLQLQVATFANSRGIAHKGATGMSIAFPDVCKTPVPVIGVTPAPYPLVGESGETQKAVKTSKDETFKSNSTHEVGFKPSATKTVDTNDLPGYDFSGYQLSKIGASSITANYAGTVKSEGKHPYSINGQTGIANSVNQTIEYTSVLVTNLNTPLTIYQEPSESVSQYQTLTFRETFIYDLETTALLKRIQTTDLRLSTPNEQEQSLVLYEGSLPLVSDLIFHETVEYTLKDHPNHYQPATNNDHEDNPSSATVPLVFPTVTIYLALLVVTRKYHRVK